MKKALVVFLILAVAGGLFAQWTGSVTTGALFTFGDEITVDASDNDGHAVKARLGYASKGDDWGVSVAVNGDRTTGNADAGYYIDGMSGWVNFGGMFTLTAGRSVGGNWRLSDALGSFNVPGSGAGVRLNIKPISALDFGFVFGYPNKNVKAGKIANFLQESGVGAKYTSDLFNVGTSLKFFSEETDLYPELDANWCIDVTAPVLGFFDVLASAQVYNLFGKKADAVVHTGIDISGEVAKVGWGITSEQDYSPDLAVTLSPYLSYGIPINDKATLDLDAGVDLTLVKDFNFDGWNASAKATYNFNGNVSTYGQFGLSGTTDGLDSPTLRWFVQYTF